MALPQGINFRASSGFVTDASPATYEIALSPNYPRTTPQGNTVGWESALGNTRDRTTSNDTRLAGCAFDTVGGVVYRIDLPSAGNYNIRAAFGDPSSVNGTAWSLLDTSTVRATLATGDNTAANSFKDATNTVRTAAAWPGSNAALPVTFTSTICRFRSDGASNNMIAHVYVETAGGGGPSTYSYTASGGFVLSGSATKVRGRLKSASGGIQTGGAAITTRRASRTASGGLQLAGSAAPTRGRIIAALGGLAFSGAASIIRRAARAGVGGIQLAGAAAISFGSAVQTRVVTPTGGMILAGVGAIRRSIRKFASGGLTLGGAATVVESGTVITPARLNASTIIRFSSICLSAPASETSIAATGGMKAKLYASSLMKNIPINAHATMSNAALNLTANLL